VSIRRVLIGALVLGAAASGLVPATGAGAAQTVEIKVGGVSTLNFYPGLDAGAKARFARANKDHEVPGAKFTFIGTKDDGGDGTRNLQLAQGLVQKDKVFAVLPVATAGLLPQSSDYLKNAGVPFLGWGYTPGFCNNDFGFGFNGCLVNAKWLNTSVSEPAISLTGKPGSQIQFGDQADDVDAGRLGNRQYVALFKKAGAKIVYDKSNMPPEGVTDYSPWVRETLAQNPNVFYENGNFPNVVGLTAALRSAGYKGISMNFVAYVPGLLGSDSQTAAALDGSYVNTQVPPQEEQSPAIKQVEKDLKAIGEKPFISLGTSISYWSADVLIQMLKAAAKKSPQNLSSSAKAVAAVNQGFTYKPALPGGIGEMTYPKAHQQPVPCAAVLKVDAATKSYVPSEKFKCYSVIPAG
jgi:ABC-type branched-subunit amino acid transport system substrate-binding protein